MALILQNFASALTTVAIGTSDTSITVGSTSSLPTLTASDDHFYAVITSATDLTKREIVRVTAINGTTLTVIRAQEGTTALAFPVGSLLEQRITKNTLYTYIQQMLGSNRGFSNISVASYVITASDIGKLLFASYNGQNIWLPTPSSLGMFPGQAVDIFTTSATATIQPGSGATINHVGTASIASISLLPGQSIRLVAVTDTIWQSVASTCGLGQNTDFTVSKATNGYQKLPSGLIIQWGNVTTNTSGIGVFTHPIAFPNTKLRSIVSVAASSAAYTASWNDSNDLTPLVNTPVRSWLSGSGIIANVQVLLIGY